MSADVLNNPRILAGDDVEQMELHHFARGTAAAYTARHPEKDSVNEDAAALIPVDPDRGILAVADGLGGQPAGEVASELTLRTLALGAAEISDTGAALRGCILDCIERANQVLTTLGTGAATTLAAVELDGRMVRPYHVGDSMILVVGQRGRLRLQTLSHSPVGYAVEAGLLDEQEAIHHEDRHVVSNILGAADMRIEVGTSLRLNRRDTIVLGTDGLFDNLHVPEITDLVRTGPLDRAARRLAEIAGARMRETGADGRPSKPDDLTFVLYRPGS